MFGRFAFLRSLGHAAKVLPVLALIGCLALLLDRLATFDPQGISDALGQLDGWQWLGALGLTAISFASIGQYDAVIHRVLGTGVRPGRARAAGIRAIALSQTVGFASLSGGLVRLRCLPELDLWTVTRLTLLVSLSFLGSWAVLTGIVVLLGHGGPTGLLVGLLGMIVWGVIRLRPTVGFPGLTPRIGASLLLWTTIDTTCAALVLGVLLPPGLMPDFHTMFAAYLLALGAGLLSQSPAGLGAFELTLLVLLPQVPEGPLLAAVVAYRVIYFLVPALCAVILLIRPAEIPAPALLHIAQGSARDRALVRAPLADWGLVHQGADILLAKDQSTGWLVKSARFCLVAIGQPLGRAEPDALRSMAHINGQFPILYKCDARTAQRARKLGWTVTRIAQDAVIRLDGWSLEMPACRQLRRKLRQVQTAGLRIECTSGLPLADMALIAEQWSQRNGGEKGFSMGQFDPALLRHQRVFLGYMDDQLVGFVSFHVGKADWSLDLTRFGPDAPAGTMHALICAGLTGARQASVLQVSLAAAPCWPGILGRISARWRGVAGLRQFKSSFAPVWRPLYLCAPSRTGLVLGAASITAAIHLPPKPGGHATILPTARPLHGDDENFQFENTGPTCDAQVQRLRRAQAAIPANPRPDTGHNYDPRAQDKRPFPPA